MLLLEPVRAGGTRSGAALFFCGTFTGPFTEIEGLFTVLICIPCLESVRPSRPPSSASTTQASPGKSGAARSTAAASGFLAPGDLEWHTAADHPGWTAIYQLLRPYPNQRMRVVFRRVEVPPTT